MTKSKWLPITTAPKDGTPILVYEKPGEYAEEGDTGIYLVQWRAFIIHYPGCHPIEAWCVPGSDQDEQGGCFTIDNPTHWMPLPKPPKETP